MMVYQHLCQVCLEVGDQPEVGLKVFMIVLRLNVAYVAYVLYVICITFVICMQSVNNLFVTSMQLVCYLHVAYVICM
jgi:hypothetical protein